MAPPAQNNAMISFDSFYNIDTLTYLLKNFLFALSISSLSTFSGILLMSLACLSAFQKKRLGAYGKGARQLATLGLIFGWSLLVVVRVWLYYFPDKTLEYCWMGMIGAVLLQSLHFSCWKTTNKSHFILHKGIAFLNAIFAACTAIPIIFLLRAQMQELFPADIISWGVLHPFLSLSIVQEHLSYFHVVSIGLSVLLTLSAPAAWGAITLPFFKKYQDFGRDHYKTLVNWLSHWARNTWLCVWLVQCLTTLAGTWYLWQETTFSANDLALIAGWQILWLLPAVLWTMACRSGHPLRHKLGLFVALLISISLF